MNKMLYMYILSFLISSNFSLSIQELQYVFRLETTEILIELMKILMNNQNFRKLFLKVANSKLYQNRMQFQQKIFFQTILKMVFKNLMKIFNQFNLIIN